MTRFYLSDDDLAVFSLDSGAAMRDRICQRLEIDAGEHEEREFEDGEHKIRPLESVRGRDVYVVESLYGDAHLSVNDKLVRMLIFLGALGDAGARRLTAVVPYLCYARKDMKTKARDPVTTRYVAQLFEAVGTERMVVLDVHNRSAFQNAFRIGTEHLTAATLFVDTFAERIGQKEVAVVSPDSGGVKRAGRFRQMLETRLDRPVSSAFVEKFRSEGVLSGGRLVGDVEGRVVIIVDDLISSGSTLVRAAEACVDEGATETYAAVTHGVFSKDAGETIGDSALQKVVLLDTISPERIESKPLKERIEVIDAAPLLAEAIGRLHTERSIVDIS